MPLYQIWVGPTNPGNYNHPRVQVGTEHLYVTAATLEDASDIFFDAGCSWLQVNQTRVGLHCIKMVGGRITMHLKRGRGLTTYCGCMEDFYYARVCLEYLERSKAGNTLSNALIFRMSHVANSFDWCPSCILLSATDRQKLKIEL